MKLLVTGGTVYVSKYTAEYFVRKGHEVYVLNRGNHPQVEGVKLIKGDRKNLGDTLKHHHFDAVLDINSYTGEDVKLLTAAIGSFDTYIFISSSAVYPETNVQPFTEEQTIGANSVWGNYGTNKIDAEEYLFANYPSVYALRPPYLYGRMNNIYREAFIFDCADKDLPFPLPKDGSLPLQFFDTEDLCRFMEILLEKKPERKVFNVGNDSTVSIKEWVTLCYAAAGKVPTFYSVDASVDQNDYFPFPDYGYVLGVERQKELMGGLKSMEQGLKESYEWYKANPDEMKYAPYLDYIAKHLQK